jgi:hypothetical protein
LAAAAACSRFIIATTAFSHSSSLSHGSTKVLPSHQPRSI